MRPTIIMDMDGTLSDDSRRRVHADARDWDAYHATMMDDPCVEGTVDMVRAMYMRGVIVLILTARPGRYEALTEEWLHRNSIPYHALVMRKDGDMRRSGELKAGMAEYMKKLHDLEYLFAVDDQGDVIQAFREMGILSFHCMDRGG